MSKAHIIILLVLSPALLYVVIACVLIVYYTCVTLWERWVR